MLTIDAGTLADVDALAARITPADQAELDAAGMTVHECLEGVALNALRFRESLVCLFGAVPVPGVDGVGVPWMLCTTDLYDVPKRAMAEVSADVVIGWRGEFRKLVNLVHRHNEQAIRFVEWLGFTVSHEPAGPGGEFFVFEWEAPSV